MRRKDREITDAAEIDAIMDEAEICRIGLSDDGQPYVLPVCFVREGASVYIHSAPEGRKIRILERNPRCCVEAEITAGPVPGPEPCAWEMRYRSVIGTGTAHFVDDPVEKRRALELLVRRYGGEAGDIPEVKIARVCVIRIDLGKITGKRHGC